MGFFFLINIAEDFYNGTRCLFFKIRLLILSLPSKYTYAFTHSIYFHLFEFARVYFGFGPLVLVLLKKQALVRVFRNTRICCLCCFLGVFVVSFSFA